MSTRELPEGLAGTIVSQDARHYALATGWRRLDLPVRDSPGFFGRVAVYERPENGDEQVLIPLDERTSDYDVRMGEAAEAIARWEKRPVVQVANDLLYAASDMLRFRVASAVVEGGSLPLEDGLRLLDGVRTAILAAAHSVLSPARYHKRMSKGEAEQFLSACRMGQTERGSFVATVACPLRAVETDQALIDTNDDPFARKTTTLLMRSAAELVTAIESDRVREMVERNKQNPALSANLCDAIVRMKPSVDGSELTIGASWSKLRAAPTGLDVPRSVRIQQSYFAVIEDVYSELRPGADAEPDTFVGYVDTLDGEPGPGGQVEGDVVLRVAVDDEKLIRAKTTLDAAAHAIAVEAYRTQAIIRIDGVLTRGKRLGTIDSPANFQIIRQTNAATPPQ
ncbi:MAG: hypothetical protein K2W85_14205 [Phycisphaerales bacterium]|nr:hypothetical protein [Phycisphaerales bacterium]